MTLNRSFARKIGKTLSDLQKNLLENELPEYLFSLGRLEEIKSEKKLFLEIGFGMGEHFVHQASLQPYSLFIGAEVYLNGVANVLKLAEAQDVTNFLIWPHDLDLILTSLPDKILDGVYILFPDPWPKRKQQKRRILNKERLMSLSSKLRKGGFIVFGSDIVDYFLATKELIISGGNFELVAEDFTISPPGYITTKYHHKASAEGRKVQFLQVLLKH